MMNRKVIAIITAVLITFGSAAPALALTLNGGGQGSSGGSDNGQADAPGSPRFQG